jgi:hypothetical protein
MDLRSGYAIIPDHTGEPVAVFFDLADAVEWGLGNIGSDRFRIRGVALRAVRHPGDLPRPVEAGP